MSQKKLNELTRAEWLKYSISVWGDVRQSEYDRGLKESHPAIFPMEIPIRLIRTFTMENETVLDPFLGTGTTLLACKQLGRNGIGFEISPDFANIAKTRLAQIAMVPTPTRQLVICDDSRNMLKYIDEEESIDFAVTSPPYWKIQKEEKTFLQREATPYTSSEKDLGNIEDYNSFLDALKDIFHEVYRALRSGKFAVIDVMDIRLRDKFYPMHADLITKMKEVGFDLWDVIIWDRHMEYNQLTAMRYPYAFYVNKVHEYLMIFHKPPKEEKLSEPVKPVPLKQPKEILRKPYTRSRPFSRSECMGCQYKASSYCRQQCPYNLWKKQLY